MPKENPLRIEIELDADEVKAAVAAYLASRSLPVNVLSLTHNYDREQLILQVVAEQRTDVKPKVTRGD